MGDNTQAGPSVFGATEVTDEVTDDQYAASLDDLRIVIQGGQIDHLLDAAYDAARAGDRVAFSLAQGQLLTFAVGVAALALEEKEEPVQ